MNNYYEPILKGEIGKMEFELFDGLKTKSFYNVGEFDEVFGQFPILNEKEEIVDNGTSCHRQSEDTAAVFGYKQFKRQ